MHRRTVLRFFLIVSDAALVGGSFLLAYWLRFNLGVFPVRPQQTFDPYLRFSFLVSLIGFAALDASGLYRGRQLTFGIDGFFRVLKAMTLTFLAVMVGSFVLRGYLFRYETETYSRIVIATSWALSVVLLTVWRMLFDAVAIRRLLRQYIGPDRVLIVGSGELGRRFCHAVKTHSALDYEPVGFVATGTSPKGIRIDGVEVLGNGLDELAEILRTHRVDEVVVAAERVEAEEVAHLMRVCGRMDVRFSLVPDSFGILTGRPQVREVAGLPIFSVEEGLSLRWNRVAKRGMDILLALAIGTVLFPLMAVLAAGIRLESRGPILFRQKRVGKGEREFCMYKFRSMYEDASRGRDRLLTHNEADGPLFKIREDPRVTVIGRFIRRFSIDELPQIINVFAGEMSLVGPRPYPTCESEEIDSLYRRRFDVLPGMTGLSQVSGRSDLTFEEIMRLDLYYIEHWSPLLDLKILLKTIPAVLLGRGAY